MKSKDAGTISMVYGAIGCCGGLFFLLMTYVAQKMITGFPLTAKVEKMLIYLKALQTVWAIYMPLMIIIGLIYILSGWLIIKKKKEGISVGIFAGMSNLVWFTGYAITLTADVMPVFPRRLESTEEIFAIAIAGIFMCSYPLYYFFTFNRIDLTQELAD